jgi:hypothetical protein
MGHILGFVMLIIGIVKLLALANCFGGILTNYIGWGHVLVGELNFMFVILWFFLLNYCFINLVWQSGVGVKKRLMVFELEMSILIGGVIGGCCKCF